MAYASVASLLRTMESVLHSKSPMQSLICDHRKEFLTLHEKISSLKVFLKKFEEGNNSGKMIDLEAQIKEVANAVEYVIQLRLTEALMANDEMQKKQAHEKLCNSLQQVAEEIDHVHKESTKFQDKGKQASKKPLVQYSSSGKGIPDVNKKKMVGRDEERERLLKDLTRCYSGEHKVIPVVGMGGIGKTTLAKEVYNHASVRSYFDVCAWATLSQQHNVKEILLSLLRSTRGDTFHREDESELADMLQKSLKGKRYLIVLDDMWSSKAWDDVRQCFPSQNNGSRILLTTRNIEVARSVGTENLSLRMDFMDSDDCWNLFKRAAFANENLPSELESIGKQIVDKCQGLPLTILVVAGLLCKSGRTVADWESVAKDVKSFVTNDPDEQCFHVLELSYNNLSVDLKPCLLYFGIFPEDSEISVKRLVRLWMAEGFLKSEKDLDVEAKKCLQDLIDRCLVLVSKKSRDETEIKSCKVHDLIYDMCLKKVQNQNFLIMNDFKSYRTVLTPRHHHLIRENTDDSDDILLRQTRSIFSFSRHSRTFTLESELINFNLLRILDLGHIPLISLPPQIICLIWLRYLSLNACKDGIPPEIFRLWNLQTLIVEYGMTTSIFTEQIWVLTQLRQIRLNCFYLSNPPSASVEEERYFGFPEVHTIQGLSPSSCTKEVISGIQNVKKLGILGKRDDFESFRINRYFDNLVHLHQLETLSFKMNRDYSAQKISSAIIPCTKAFPATLKKLKLWGTHLRWDDLNIIGELPNLEVLKLLWAACVGKEWHPTAGGFTQLKVLLIMSSELKYWKATSDNFPILERLIIEDCSDLEKIPIEFADIDSLRLIKLKGYNPKLKVSAARIQQEQEDLGNKPVHVVGKSIFGSYYEDND